MSLQFSDPVNESGIVELIYSNTGADTIKYPLKQITRDINAALDRVMGLIFKSDGRWQFDDSNHPNYPIITTDLIQGQRDYAFTVDETSNLILDIYKVQIKPDANSPYRDIYPVDQQRMTVNGGDFSQGIPPATMNDGSETQGTPTCYDKTANGIFLDLVPGTTITNGLRVFMNREASYFVTTDTDKKPGFAGIFHEYLALRPSYQFAYRKGLQNTAALRDEMLRMEQDIMKYYGNREKDTPKRFGVRKESYK